MTPWTTSSPGWAEDRPIPDPSASPPATDSRSGGDGLDGDGPVTDALEVLATRLGYTFADPDLLVQAVTHRSWCAEHPGNQSNERLEFLGDAVLGLVVTDLLYVANPAMAEGGLAKARAQIVSSHALALVAAEIGLGAALRLGRGEHRSGGREKSSILADALEAVFGAVWLDGGLPAAAPVIEALLATRIDEAAAGPGGSDFKTRLQEVAAHRGEAGPDYELAEEGPDHAKRFTATVRLGGRSWGTGSGRSKKEAEQAAAADAFDRLGGNGGDVVGGGGDA